jgi:hypothetical protein
MTGKMRWDRARLHGRATTDFRFEEEEERMDRAQRWLRARKYNRHQGQQTMMLTRTKPAPVYPPNLHRGSTCTVQIIELPQAKRYRRVFGVLQTKCPDHVPERRWADCIRDGARFLAKWGLEAERLGWSSSDLFKLPPIPARPHPSFNRMARLDQQGLCWVLLGRRVTALSKTTATIENKATGSRTVFRKHTKQDMP